MVIATSLLIVTQSPLGFSFGVKGSYGSEYMVYQSMCMLNEVSSDASHAHFTIACHRFVSK